MRKNTITTLILALMLCTAMTGCGAEKEKAPDSTGTGTVVEIKEQKATSEILEADIYSQKIQLGDHVFTLPITLEEMIAQGAVVTDEEQKPTDMIQPLTYTDPLKLNIDGFDYSLQFVKVTELSEDGTMPNIPLNKCTFDMVIESIGNNEQETILPKGIKKGATVDELTAAWGEPTDYSESYPDTYTYKANPDKHEYVSFIIDLETKTIKYIDFNYHK